MNRLLTFSMSVKPLAQIADTRPNDLVCVWEWELPKAIAVIVIRIVANTEPRPNCRGPDDIKSTRKYTKEVGVFESDRNYLRIR